MDADRRVAMLGNQRGLALVFIALILVVICGFLGLAVDLGYMYVAKGQLQNASDAAALAGVIKLKSIGTGTADPNDLMQEPARAEALAVANMNMVVSNSDDPREQVKILSDNSNTLSSANDITVGHWNGSSYSPGVAPVNAIQARARKTADSPGNEVNLFLSKVIGWNSMGTSAEAIAGLPAIATNYITYCAGACPADGTTRIYSPPLQLDASNDGTTTQDWTKKFAWTTLSDKSTSNSDLLKLICNEPASQQACTPASSDGIYTTMGTVGDSLKAMEWAFYNPGFDTENKTFADEPYRTIVNGWNVVVPVTEFCPPGKQGSWDPHPVVKYATFHIIAICASGEGVNQACSQELRGGIEYIGYKAPKEACTGYTNNKVVIDSVTCNSCGSNAPGLKPALLR